MPVVAAKDNLSTRERLLVEAEASVLQKGFAATSIEELIEAVGVTKGAFFYHFPDKGALAREMLLRYMDNERDLFNELMARADELNEDPLHGFLVFLRMFAEFLNDHPETHPGCLIASYCYQERLFDDETKALTAESLLRWRGRFRTRLDLIAARYPPKLEVDFDALADMVSVLVDGGIILSRVTRDKAALTRQVMLYRDMVRAVFLGVEG